MEMYVCHTRKVTCNPKVYFGFSILGLCVHFLGKPWCFNLRRYVEREENHEESDEYERW